MQKCCIETKTKQFRKKIWTSSILIFLLASTYCHSQVIYETGFEPIEGYDIQYTLNGQSGWEAEGTGGNGLLKNTFQDLGNQAYIGFGHLKMKMRIILIYVDQLKSQLLMQN